MTYLINFLLVPVYFLLINTVFGKKRTKKIFFIVVTLHAILFRALADPYVYPDTEGYALAFQNIAEMSFSDAVLSVNPYIEWGPGYLALNWIIAQFTKDPAALFIVLSVLSVGGVMLFYYKTTETPLITVLFYLLYPMMYVMGFFVVRQHLAIVFILWGAYYVNDLRKCIPLFLLGISFHFTSIIVLPFLLFRNISINNLSFLKVVLATVILFLVLYFSVEYVLPYTERYNDAYAKAGNEHNIVPVLLLSSLISAFFSACIFKSTISVTDSIIVRFVIYGLVVALFGMTIPAAGRLSLYFIYALPVGLSALYSNEKNKKHPISIIYTLGLFLFVIVLFYFSSGDMYNRYQTIF